MAGADEAGRGCLAGPLVVSTTIAASVAAPYEVTADDGDHRVFVVPATIAGLWRFS